MDDTLIEFKPTDIVVYQGAITQYGIIKPLINPDTDEVRKANAEEVKRYNNRPEKTK